MKKWNRIIINKSDKITKVNKVKDFEDFCDEDEEKFGNEEGGYKSNQYYQNKKKFLEFYLKDRYLILHNYLKNNLDPKAKTLSIGTGRGINELSLISNNFNIVCSDLEVPQCYESSKKLFGIFDYIKLDIVKSTINNEFQSIVCLSTFYLFSDQELQKVFTNINKILKKDGILILEFSGTEDNLISFLFHEIYLLIEVYSVYYLSKLFNKQIGFKIDNNFGYRRKNQEIKEFAKKYGFKFIDIHEYDYLEELQRSILIEKIIKYFPLSRKLFIALGKKLPYIRMFKFKKM